MDFSTLLNQTVIYWEYSGEDGWGSVTTSSGVKINCRWENVQELFIDFKGKEVLSQGIVYLAQDLTINSYLWLGSLSDLSIAEKTNPEIVEGSYRVRSVKKIPSLDGTEFLRKVWL